MLFIVHDFWQNFINAVKSEDHILLCDIMNDEVAKIIVFNRGQTIETINVSAKKKLGKKPSDNQIIDIITDEVATNDALNKGITEIIIKNNSEPANTKMQAAGGSENNEGKQPDTVAKSDRGRFVKEGLKSFVNHDNELLLRKKVSQHIKVREMNFGANAEVVALTSKEKWALATKVFLGTTITFLAGYGIYYLGKKQNWWGGKSESASGESKAEGEGNIPAKEGDQE